MYTQQNGLTRYVIHRSKLDKKKLEFSKVKFILKVFLYEQ